MSFRSEVLEAMPVGVKLSAPMIADIIRPDAKPWERRSVIARVFKALQMEEQYHSVIRDGTVNVNGHEAVLWVKV